MGGQGEVVERVERGRGQLTHLTVHLHQGQGQTERGAVNDHAGGCLAANEKGFAGDIGTGGTVTAFQTADRQFGRQLQEGGVGRGRVAHLGIRRFPVPQLALGRDGQRVGDGVRRGGAVQAQHSARREVGAEVDGEKLLDAGHQHHIFEPTRPTLACGGQFVTEGDATAASLGQLIQLQAGQHTLQFQQRAALVGQGDARACGQIHQLNGAVECALQGAL